MSKLLVSAGSVDITPDRELPLAGFLEKRRSNGVSSRLQALAVVIKTDASRHSVVVSADLLYMGSTLVDRVTAFLCQEYSIPKADILLAASHTHFAPSTDSSKPLLGLADAEYVELVGSRIQAMLDQVMGGPFVAANVRTGSDVWHKTIYRRLAWRVPHMHRRKLVINEPVMAPDPSVAVNTRIRLWELLGPDGHTIAIVWNFACHPTEGPNLNSVSADFVGVVRIHLQEIVGLNVPVIFLQGFSGDVRPRPPRRRPLTLRKLAHLLIFGPVFEVFDQFQWDNWSRDLAAAVGRALAEARSRPVTECNGDIQTALIEVPLSQVISGGAPPNHSVTFQRLKIATMFDIFAVSAEVSDALRAAIVVPDAVTVGCADHCFGYWPTDRQRREGGYEGGRYFPAFSLKGRLRPGLDEIFVNAIATLNSGQRSCFHRFEVRHGSEQH